MDEGAWKAAVHGVAEGRTWLSDFTFFHFHALEKEMATHSSVFAWRIPGMGEPGGLLSMGSQRVGHNWSDLAAAAAAANAQGNPTSPAWGHEPLILPFWDHWFYQIEGRREFLWGKWEVLEGRTRKFWMRPSCRCLLQMYFAVRQNEFKPSNSHPLFVWL